MLEANQTMVELADLLGTQRGPVSQDDAVAVERDFIHIVRLMGPMAALKHLKSSAKGHRLLSPLEVLEATNRDWKAHLETKSQNSCLQRKAGWPSSTSPRSTSLKKQIGLPGISATRPSYNVKHG